MLPHLPYVKSMYLTPQEAMDLLDLCVISQAEMDPDKERVIGKLTEFVRHCIIDEQNYQRETTCP